MVVTLSPDLEIALKAAAQRAGISPESLALDALRQRFLVSRPIIEPRDDWERALLAIGRPYGANLSNEALSSEGIYE